ncbi:hypothetical protein [Arthrobacter sp. Edens01]|uniref:hypothetical protein n=1 Tax=Arthrobacter sp. Edens01 TaxID=1732020 RepID=UPI0006DB005D|nr:hypothetical protein [Arthrobacter sp. Edens01]KPN22028.1 hypothetical protein AO716_03250 [Arthrobacter sp. Edens01]
MSGDEKVLLGILVKLEKRAQRVSGGKLFDEGLDAYLDLQEQLFELQVEVQTAIAEAKRRGPKNAEVLDYLNKLRWVRWQSRRLGDAIAWQALLLNRQVIYALAENDPVPVPSSWSEGHRGAFQFARSMTSSEWGIPIVHDITNVLRIGDLTFMRPTGLAAEADYRTIELKTSRLDEREIEGGKTTVTLGITAISTEPFPSYVTDPPHSNPDHTPNTTRRRRADRRIERQLARMEIATASKNAPLHKSTKIGNQHVFPISLPEEQKPHWKELRRAIRQARRDGNAYFELGGFVGYSLIYNSDGVSSEDILSTSLNHDVRGLLHEEIGDRNSITLSMIPDNDQDTYSSRVLPFYLWEVPQRAVRDILRNRLVIAATYNSGWMEKLLANAGLTIVPDETDRDRRGFEVIASFGWEGEARAEYHFHVWEEMFVAVHEFRGPDAVVQRALAPTSLPTLVKFEEFIPAEGPADNGGRQHP